MNTQMFSAHGALALLLVELAAGEFTRVTGWEEKKERKNEDRVTNQEGSSWRFYFGNLEEVLRWNEVNLLPALFMFNTVFLQLLGWIATRGCSCRRRRARPSFLASHWRMLAGGKSLTTPNIVRRNKVSSIYFSLRTIRKTIWTEREEKMANYEEVEILM
jgi:hypothetical protein